MLPPTIIINLLPAITGFGNIVSADICHYSNKMGACKMAKKFQRTKIQEMSLEI